MNISTVELNKTANTCQNAAEQRAKRLARTGSIKVLEACVGPSFEVLEKEYTKHNIECYANDIDSRWKKYYPHNNWLIEDITKLDFYNLDTVVFAPPLSKGCSGKREDSLRPLQVQPGYLDFINRLYNNSFQLKTVVLTLPGRSMATTQDRNETWQIFAAAYKLGNVSMHPLIVKGVQKYLDLQIKIGSY